MKAIKLTFFAGCVAALALPITLLQAQQRGPGFGVPGGGLGVRGAGGCFFEEGAFGNKKPSGDYSLNVVRSETRGLASGNGSTTTMEDSTVVHDNGITFVETTRDSKTFVCISDPEKHVSYLVTLTSPDNGTALEFRQPTRGPRPPDGMNGQNPSWNGKADPNVTHYTNIPIGQVLGDIPNGEQPSTVTSSTIEAAWGACALFDVTVAKRGNSNDVRVFCSSPAVNLYTFMSTPYVKSTVTATFNNSVTPPVTYVNHQLPPGIIVTTPKRGPGNQRGGQPSV